MLANRISFFMDLHGPSYNLDSACSSSLFILNQALEAIKNEKCDAAIVCAANLLLLPNTSLSYGRLNILAPDGIGTDHFFFNLIFFFEHLNSDSICFTKFKT